ncbi:unnamed protein product [Adineta ricciae]|uniref:Uncharacterized protein n=1 Tax=Adineta ricciae TaxID=249248 RepID=A0A816D1R4_ADIRI|nr:unnamed protein product [Adineta ricciae]
MGSAACRSKVKQYDQSVQIPSVSPCTSTSTPPPGQPYPTVISWPSSTEKGFKVKTNTEQYTSVWDQNTKLSSIFPQSLKSRSNKIEHHQKETIITDWSKANSTNVDSTHIESTINSQTQSSIHISTSNKIDELINNLNHIHNQQDEGIKRRTQQISAETEYVLMHIINETQQEQQRLLQYAKEQQIKQDEHYRQLLQTYISQLDEMKAKDLAQLQEELDDCREQIMQASQLKIMSVNEQANMIKSKIVREEQQQATMEIDTVNMQLQNLITDSNFQNLDSEIVTKTNVIVNANTRTKPTDQVIEDVKRTDEQSMQHTYTKTMYSNLKVNRRFEHDEEIVQIGKKIPINPILQVQKSR